MKKLNCKKAEAVICYLLLFVTAFWFFLYINKGIDVTDVAYYLAKYKYYFDAEMKLKSMGTFLTDFFGAILYQVSDSHQALILSFGHWALYMGSGLCVYHTLKNYVPRIILGLSIFTGSLFSLTWIHVMNYNATSMFIQTLGICVLIKGLEKEKNCYYFFAGLLFAINTFFRVPNVLQIGLGVVIFWYFGICKNEWTYGVKAIAIYVAGVICGGAIGFTFAFYYIGIEGILTYFVRTATTAGSLESSHGLVNIITTMIKGLILGAIGWIKYGIVPLILLVIEQKCLKEKSSYVKRIMIGLLVCAGVLAGGIVDFSQFFQMAGIAIIVILFWGAIYHIKKDKWISAVCFVGLCAELILTIGTNNGWYYQVVFLILPLALCSFSVSHSDWVRKNEIVISMMVFAGVLAVSCGLHYASTYVYRDAENKELKYETNSDIYQGIYTSKERSEFLNQLEVDLNALDGKYMLAYGDCNIGYVISDKKPIISDKVWVDLDSYSVQRFETDLTEAVEENGYPIVLLAKQDVYRSEEKLSRIYELLDNGEYDKICENIWYCIYIPVLK